MGMMAPATLLASALLALATGAGFGVIGWLVARRPASGSAHSATVCFSLFWHSAAVIWIAQGLGSLSGFAGLADRGLLVTLDQIATPFYCLAAASLLFYVLYLLTGRPRLLLPILLYYLVLFAALRHHVEQAHPIGVEVRDWQVNLVHETPLQGLRYTILIGLVALPLVAAILAYGSLFFRVVDPGVRYRIGCVTLGLAVWISTEALSYSTGAAATTAGELARRLVALGSAFVVLAGYLPARWARERWGAQPAL